MTPFDKDLIANRRYLFRCAMKFTSSRDTAEDMVQSTMMKALAARDSFEAGTNFRGWLLAIMRNEFFTAWRKRRREIEDADGQIAASTPDPLAANFEAMDELRHLMERLDRLTPLDKALLLDAADGLDYERMAVRHRIALGTVKSRLFRARAKLMESA